MRTDYWFFDFIWLAVDADYHVAAFTTAGSGPIPASVFSMGWEIARPIEDAVLNLLPLRGAGQAIGKSVPFFEALAARGLFIYDWSDVHRTIAEGLNQYERVSVPTSPLTTSNLPFALQEPAWTVELHEASFAGSSLLDIRSHVPCIDRPR